MLSVAEYPVPSGEFLLIAASLASIQLAQGRSEEELGLMAAFFTVLGDNLALLAVTRPAPEEAADGGAKKDCALGKKQVE